MNYPATLGRYLEAHHPGLAAYSRHYSYGVDGTEYCELVGWLPEYGEPPTPEDVAKWEPPTLPGPDPLAQLRGQLDALEDARAALIRQLRAQVAVALIANGWSQPDTMAAGRDFFAAHAADIYGYVSGAAPAFAAAVAIDGREWLDLPAGGGQSIRELFAEALGA